MFEYFGRGDELVGVIQGIWVGVIDGMCGLGGGRWDVGVGG